MEARLSEKEIQQLVKESQSGNTKSFERIYKAYIQAIYKFVYFKVEENAVEDLVERAFIKAWENISKYKKTKATFSSWLFRITNNLIIDHYRAHRSVEPVEDLQIEDQNRLRQPKIMAQNSLDKDRLQDALKLLNARNREVIILRHINGLSYAEIGKVLGKTESSVRVINFRALGELKNILTESGFSM